MEFYAVADNDIKKIEVSIEDSNGENFDMDELKQTFNKSIKKQKDKVDNITKLGMAIIGDQTMADAFMFGWVLQKIVANYENINNTKLTVKTKESSIDKNEIKNTTAEMFNNIADKIKSGEVDIVDMLASINGIRSNAV